MRRASGLVPAKLLRACAHVSEFSRRISAEQPGPILAAHQLVAFGESGEVHGCGRTLAADQRGYVTVGESERHDGPLLDDVAKPVCKMPEQDEQPELDVLETVNADVKRQRVGALDSALDDRVDEGRPARTDSRQTLVEQPESDRLITLQLTSNGSGA